MLAVRLLRRPLRLRHLRASEEERPVHKYEYQSLPKQHFEWSYRPEQRLVETIDSLDKEWFDGNPALYKIH